MIYYVSNNGSDSNDGSELTPFATIEHAESQADADLILLERGSKFRGYTPSKSGTIETPIRHDAYGVGQKPIISGGKILTSAVRIEGTNIWRYTDAGLQARTNLLKINGNTRTVARFPKGSDSTGTNGYYQTLAGTSGNATGQIVGAELNGRDFTGAEICHKKVKWILDRMKIVSHTGNTVQFDNGDPVYAARSNWGYFVQNHRGCLTANLDWCQEGNDILVYFSNNDPQNYEVEASFHYRIHFNNRPNNHYDNIKFEMFNGGGTVTRGSNDDSCIWIQSSPNLRFLSGVEIEDMGNTVFAYFATQSNGFYFSGEARKCLNNFFWNRYSTETRSFTIEDATLEDIGYVIGGSWGGSGYSGIIDSPFSLDATVRRNKLNRIGYIGVYWHGTTEVSHNDVNEACLLTSDGGCYYSFGKFGQSDPIFNQNQRLIHHNRARNSKGNAWGTNRQFEVGGVPEYDACKGFYCDDHTNGYQLYNNVAINCERGFMLQNNFDISINGNISYDCFTEGLLLTHSNTGTVQVRDVDVQNNIFYAMAGQLAATFNSKENDFAWGVINNNYYMRPLNENGLIRNVSTGGGSTFNLSLSLQGWKDRPYGFDADSLGTPNSSTESTLVFNDTFESKSYTVTGLAVDQDNVEVPSEFTLEPFTYKLLLGDVTVVETGGVDPTPTGVIRKLIKLTLV